jgi:hypothetical protein
MLSSKRHFKVVINSKEHGIYTSSTPSSAARKAVTKLCANNKNKKVEFYMRETTQGFSKKVYGLLKFVLRIFINNIYKNICKNWRNQSNLRVPLFCISQSQN